MGEDGVEAEVGAVEEGGKFGKAKGQAFGSGGAECHVAVRKAGGTTGRREVRRGCPHRDGGRSKEGRERFLTARPTLRRSEWREKVSLLLSE